MSSRSVRISNQGDARLSVAVTWAPRWGPTGELPVHTNRYHDGTWDYFGSGSAVANVSAVPITLRVRAGVSSGYVRRFWPSGFGEGDAVALRKIVGQASSVASGATQLGDLSTWPMLIEYLTATQYPDGGTRQVSSLIIVADSSSWRGCVSDKDNDRTLWRSSATLEGLLLELEQALAADDPSSWRQAGGGFKGRKKRS